MPSLNLQVLINGLEDAIRAHQALVDKGRAAYVFDVEAAAANVKEARHQLDKALEELEDEVALAL